MREARFVENTRARYPLHDYQRLARLMHRLRAVKSEEEVALLKQACAITRAGFLRVCKFVKPGVNETEVEAEFAHEFIRRGGGFAYPPIIASGENACVLHYWSTTRCAGKASCSCWMWGLLYANYKTPRPDSHHPGQRSVHTPAAPRCTSPPPPGFREDLFAILLHFRDDSARRSCFFVPRPPNEQIQKHRRQINSLLR